MEAAINSIWSELEETINNQVEDILASVNQGTQGLHKELNMKIETQLGLQVVTMSLDTWTQHLHEEIMDTKQDLHKELDLRIQGTQAEI
jgi:calcineurin-like phosphoesterase